MASGGYEIWVSSTSFTKSNNSRPQQPPTEKALKFNMIFYDCSKNTFFQNIKTKLNSRIWMTKVLSSDFSDLCSLIDLTGLYSLKSTSSPKNFMILMVGSSLAPKCPILSPFFGMDHQKPDFSLISDTLSIGGCWGRPADVTFLKLVDETEIFKPPEATKAGTIFQNNHQSFYPSEPFSLVHFNMIHPVLTTLL